MPRESKEGRLAQAAARWDLQPDELRAIVEMVESSPWEKVERLFQNETRQAERALRGGDSMNEVARAQGALEATDRVRQGIRRYIESYREAMRDD